VSSATLIGDIDFVVQPKSACDWTRIIDRCIRNGKALAEGTKVFRFLLNVNKVLGVKVEIWSASNGDGELFPIPSNWGSVLLCRTGSRAFSVSVAARAKRMGLAWVINRGIVVPATHIKDAELARKNGDIIASATEEEIFEALQMPFIQPADRNDYYAD